MPQRRLNSGCFQDLNSTKCLTASSRAISKRFDSVHPYRGRTECHSDLDAATALYETAEGCRFLSETLPCTCRMHKLKAHLSRIPSEHSREPCVQAAAVSCTAFKPVKARADLPPLPKDCQSCLQFRHVLPHNFEWTNKKNRYTMTSSLKQCHIKNACPSMRQRLVNLSYFVSLEHI